MTIKHIYVYDSVCVCVLYSFTYNNFNKWTFLLWKISVLYGLFLLCCFAKWNFS